MKFMTLRKEQHTADKGRSAASVDWQDFHGNFRASALELESFSFGAGMSCQPDSKVPKYGVSVVSVLAIVIIVWGIYFIFGYLES